MPIHYLGLKNRKYNPEKEGTGHPFIDIIEFEVRDKEILISESFFYRGIMGE